MPGCRGHACLVCCSWRKVVKWERLELNGNISQRLHHHLRHLTSHQPVTLLHLLSFWNLGFLGFVFNLVILETHLVWCYISSPTWFLCSMQSCGAGAVCLDWWRPKIYISQLSVLSANFLYIERAQTYLEMTPPPAPLVDLYTVYSIQSCYTIPSSIIHQ